MANSLNLKRSLSNNAFLKRPALLISIVLSFVYIFVMMFCFRYSDIKAYQVWSLEFLDCVFGKTDVEFYQYTYMDPRESLMPMPCDHSILTMLPVIIWDIPLWIYHEVRDIMPAGGFEDMIWLKTGLVICQFFVAWHVSKIIRKINPSIDSVIAYPIIFMSGDFMISTMYCGQDEVVYILFLVMALRYLIYNKKWLFLACSTVAVTLNPLTLLPVLLMILYMEKNVLFILIYTITTVVPTGIFELAYKNNVIYQNAVVMNGGAMKSLFSTGVTLDQTIGKVPVLIILFCALLFLSFVTSYDEKNHYTVVKIMAAMTMGQILLSTGSYLDYFYRSPLYIPFLAAMVLCSRKNLQTNLILYGLYTSFQNWLCLCNENNLNSFNFEISNEYIVKNYNNFGCLIFEKYIGERIPVLMNLGLFTAVCMALGIILFAINRSKSEEVFITNLSSSKLVLILSLYMPMILTLFVGMCADYAFRIPYQKQIFFGSEYLDQTLGYYNINYITYSNMHTYEHMIVYESGTCLINGYDEEGVRKIYPEGISFGPYTTLYPGTYQVIISGENLDEIGLACSSSVDDVFTSIPLLDASLSEGQASYQITIDDITPNVEFSVFNNTAEDVILHNIMIQELK